MIPSTVKNQVGNSIQELLIESDPFDPHSARYVGGERACLPCYSSRGDKAMQSLWKAEYDKYLKMCESTFLLSQISRLVTITESFFAD